MTTRRSFVMGVCAALAQSAENDVEFLSLTSAAERVRRRTISPLDLTRLCLQRIERHNARLNAYITVNTEAALAHAAELEAELRRGHLRGPLHGIPIALKDNIDTAGIRTTAASELFKDRIPAEDAEVVRRLKNGGAILIGKTNLHEFGMGGSSTISYFGPVHNPWAQNRVPGGSSGGSAVAVAAALCFGSLGSDTAGSVRLPAAYCGVVGFKPTYGRVSNRGVIPGSPTLDHVGPICRTVADAALMLGVIAGYDPMDPSTADRPIDDYVGALRMQTSRLRVGIPRTPFFDDIDSEIASAVEKAIALIRRLTASVSDTTLPTGSMSYDEIWATVRGVEGYTYHARWMAESPQKYQPFTLRSILAPPNAQTQNSAAIKATDYVRARSQVDLLRRQIRNLFTTLDVLVMPTIMAPPVEISRGADPKAMSFRNAMPFDVLGLPAISLPCGFTTSGLPIGLQIVGAPFAERTVLALAHSYEQATEWHHRRPPET